MKAENLVACAVADSICALLGIAHQSYPATEASTRGRGSCFARGSWVDHYEDTLKSVSSYKLPGDQVFALSFFLAAAEAHLGVSFVPNEPSKVIVTAMCLALLAEMKESARSWEACLSSLSFGCFITDIPPETLCSFFVRNKEWLQLQLMRENLNTATSRVLQRLRREVF